MNTDRALRELLEAIDAGVERRVMLDKRPGERRTETVLLMPSIQREYFRARRALGDKKGRRA